MAYRVSFRTTSLVAGSTYDQNTFRRKGELPQEMRGFVAHSPAVARAGRERERERERESFITNNVHKGVVSGAAPGPCQLEVARASGPGGAASSVAAAAAAAAAATVNPSRPPPCTPLSGHCARCMSSLHVLSSTPLFPTHPPTPLALRSLRGLQSGERDARQVEKLQSFVRAIHQALVRGGKLPAYQRLALCWYHLPPKKKMGEEAAGGRRRRGGGVYSYSSDTAEGPRRRDKY